VTGTDGTYSALNLEPGFYSVAVSLAEGQQVLRQDVTVDNDGVPGVNTPEMRNRSHPSSTPRRRSVFVD